MLNSNHPYKTIFISHANAEDNYFSAWLSSKLNLLGYDTWCDVEKLKGGEDFWIEIPDKIRNQAIKFLFITSKESIKKDGTLKELAIADKIKDRGEFIIPIRIDQIPYENLPPELIRKVAIDFSNSWNEGLVQLVDKLQTDSVPKSESDFSKGILPFWYKALGLEYINPIPKDENYLSNWFRIELPQKIYVHVPNQFQPYDLRNVPYPIMRDKGFFLTFASPDSLKNLISITKTYEVETTSFLAGPECKLQFDNLNEIFCETGKKIVQLMNDAFIRFMSYKGLNRYQLSGQRSAFFFPLDYPNVADLKKYGRRRVVIFGKSKEMNWHFALEGSSFLFPLPAYSINYHIIFTQEGIPFPNLRRQHSLRRSIAKNWFNKKWQDMLLVAIASLSDKNENILSIPIGLDQTLIVHADPIIFNSHIGYIEPSDIKEE